MSEENQFTCKNCGDITTEQDYGTERHLYTSLKEQELCETCAKMTEEERKNYVITIRVSKALIETRKKEITDKMDALIQESAFLHEERKSLESLSAKDLAWKTMKALEKKEGEGE